MMKKIFRLASFAILSIFLISSVLFTGWARLEALSEETSGEYPINNLTEPSKDNKESIGESNINSYPDLGDDQVFPFVAGLDSYE